MLVDSRRNQIKTQLFENKGEIIGTFISKSMGVDTESSFINQSVSEENKMTLAQELLIPLLNHGMNKTQIANSLSVSRTTIDRWQKGVEPQFFHLKKLVSLYSVIVCASL